MVLRLPIAQTLKNMLNATILLSKHPIINLTPKFGENFDFSGPSRFTRMLQMLQFFFTNNL